MLPRLIFATLPSWFNWKWHRLLWITESLKSFESLKCCIKLSLVLTFKRDDRQIKHIVTSKNSKWHVWVLLSSSDIYISFSVPYYQIRTYLIFGCQYLNKSDKYGTNINRGDVNGSNYWEIVHGIYMCHLSYILWHLLTEEW